MRRDEPPCNLVSMKARTALDLVGVYLTPQMGVGQRLRLDTIQRRLSALPLVPTLDLLAQIVFRADDVVSTPDERIEFAQQVLPPAHATRAARILRAQPETTVLSSQALTALALHALVQCRGPEPGPPPDRLARMLGELALAMAGLLESEPSDSDVLLEIVRAELWFRLQDLDRWYEVCHRLVLEVLPTLNGHPDWIDHRALVETATGLTLERFLALTSAMGILVRTKGYHVFPHYFEGDRVSREEVDRWTSLFTVPLLQARTAAEHDIEDTRYWSFTAFFDRPLVDIGGGRRLLVRPWFLALKGTPTGYYNFVELLLREQGGDTLRWSRAFGRAVEALGRRIADEHLGDRPSLADEDAVRERWGPGKACDLVVLGDRWVAIDFVHRRVSKQTATTGGIDALAKDLRFGVLDKLTQIDGTLTRGFTVDGPPPGGAYPLVVTGAPFPVNGLVMGEIDRRIEDQGQTTIRVHPACRWPTVMDLGEYWMLLETVEAEDVHPGELLEAWMASPLAPTSFRNWLVTAGPGQPALRSARRYWAHARADLFGRDLAE